MVVFILNVNTLFVTNDEEGLCEAFGDYFQIILMEIGRTRQDRIGQSSDNNFYLFSF